MTRQRQDGGGFNMEMDGTICFMRGDQLPYYLQYLWRQFVTLGEHLHCSYLRYVKPHDISINSPEIWVTFTGSHVITISDLA